MAENKINFKLLSLTLLSFVFSLAAYLIYTFVPQSDLANSIEHSGMDAVYVLTFSPVLSGLSAILLVLSFVLNKEYIKKIIPVPVAAVCFAVVAVLVIISTVFSIMFVVSQYDLGFTAPINGTRWQSYGTFLLVTSIVHFIFTAFITLNMKGNTSKK